MLEMTQQSKLDRIYDDNFVITPEYKASLPDLQNGPSSLIQGKIVKLERVGIHNFRIPLQYFRRDNSTIELETSVTGTVSLEAHKKGINMSRIMESFYKFRDETFSIDLLEQVLQSYQTTLDSLDACLTLSFSYPILQNSLRSGKSGYQYYNVALEAVAKDGVLKKYMHFDFVYSSACPCSFELAEHARTNRNKAVVSHSQRSVARISIEFNEFIWIEEVMEMCLKALQTETQVIVKREDEQAFAELNGSYLKFVEDAARLLYEVFEEDSRILDFKIVATHLESLHSHDAIAVVTKGIEGGFVSQTDPDLFKSLIR